MGQDTPAQPLLKINAETLEVVHQFQYLGSTMTDTLSLDAEISKRIGMAFTTLSKFTERVWENKHLKIPTKVNVYKACVISTLLYGGESWTTYSSQERKLQAFHFRCLRRILGITWQDKVPNNEVLSRAGIPSMYTLLRQRRDMKACNINTETWEASADDRTTWKQLVSQGLDSGEKAVRVANDGARAKRAARQQACTTSQQSTVFVCQFCSRRCSSRIGLFSHSRCCSSSKSQDTIP